MTFPLVYNIGTHTIYFHLITDILSSLVGGYLYWHSSKNDNISSDLRVTLLIGTGIGALLGSRLIGSLENPILFFNPPSLLYYYASKTIIGGIAGGILGMEITKKITKYKKSTGDRITLPLIVSIIIGRIGCFLTGVTDGTVGNACSNFWCLDQGDAIMRHPTSLYEILFLIILIAIYFRVKNGKYRQDGIIFRAFVISYFLFRFFIEYIKPINSLILGLSVIQIVCIFYILWYAYDIRKILKYGN